MIAKAFMAKLWSLRNINRTLEMLRRLHGKPNPQSRKNRDIKLLAFYYHSSDGKTNVWALNSVDLWNSEGKTISTLRKPGTRWHRRRAPDYRFPDSCLENFSLIFMGIFHCFAGTVSGEQWHRNVMHRGLGNWCIFWHIYLHCCREFSRNARARLFIDFQPPMAQRDVVKWHLKMHAKSSIGTSSCRYGWCNRIPSP